jgi:hypothetical protein
MFKPKIGEIIPDLKINWKPAPYPVVDDNAVRAWAWLMFIVWLVAFVFSLTTHTPDLAIVLVPIITFDLFIKVLFWPKYSPFMIMWKYLVRDKKPEYVWAKQKQFAWILWLLIAFIVLWFLMILGKCGPAMLFCLICLIFMWAEAVLWNCIWCNIYAKLRDKGHIEEEEYAPVCAWGSCDIKNR